ncbi:MAG: 50S ribosomal protein L29 [Acidobacteria bacterium]|nr:50S ribosomal protein L29 [Acidobacteriota bacterium]
MKIDKIRQIDAAEYGKQLKDISEQMFRLRFQMNMGQTDGVKKYREIKKDRARILTVQREAELANANTNQAAASTKKKAGK